MTDYWEKRSEPGNFAMFSVTPEGRLGVLGDYQPATEAEEAAHIRDLNASEIEDGKMPWPNTEWAYRPELMPTERNSS